MSPLESLYKEKVSAALKEKFGYDNVHQIPTIEKIVLNVGMGEAVQNPKNMDHAVDQLATITGQKPIVTRAKKSIASFKLRQGMQIGCMTTLRGKRMWEFLDRLLTVALPRVRDFRGLSPRSFDGRGNYTLGVKEQLIFPEIDFDKIDKVRGMNISFVTTATTNDEAKELISGLGFPFRD